MGTSTERYRRQKKLRENQKKRKLKTNIELEKKKVTK